VGSHAEHADGLHVLVYLVEQRCGPHAHVIDAKDWICSLLGQLRFDHIGGLRIGAEYVLNERNLLLHRRAARGRIAEVLKDHVQEAVHKLLQRHLGLFRKDTLNCQVFCIVKIRRLCVLERSIAEGQLRAAKVEVLVKAI
jgi:hypothetical protein